MSLVTHSYGNYVVQRLIKTFNEAGYDLPHSLRSILNNNRAFLKGDTWGKQVLITYDKTQK
ncbi:unnamed protein product [Brassica oleracea var. botrytis]|uniref:PUM-HD domain-containing protein n=2 Tax=Brassica TaxID=3705 RepID=A0A3P6DYC3_BRAOL|nr:unnamed protein product [Brassica napus]CDY51465.1 BnaC09g35890D [Brassica napus]VDD32830.1 unnamed protein product [Brassica oleracea]